MSKIKERLKIQQEIEGFTPETGLLLKLIPKVKSASQWDTLTDVKHHRYGKYSYETHIFYYPSKLLMDIINLYEDK